MDRSSALLLAVLVASPPALAAPHRHPKPAPATPAGQGSGVRTTLPDPEVAPPPGSSHSEGDYSGVSPDHPGKPDPNQKMKRPSPGTLSWIGFEAKDGGAEIFLQSIAAFELSQHVEGSTLVVDVPLPRLGQNTWRDVDTRYFDSPISHIVARRVGAARATKVGPAHGAGIQVRIAFKNPKDAHEGAVRSATEADGLYYAYLSFAGAGAATGEPSMSSPEK